MSSATTSPGKSSLADTKSTAVDTGEGDGEVTEVTEDEEEEGDTAAMVEMTAMAESVSQEGDKGAEEEEMEEAEEEAVREESWSGGKGGGEEMWE